MENTALPQEQQQPAAAAPRIPWLRRKELGFWHAFAQTLWQVVFTPRKFFDSLSQEQGKNGAVSFFLCASGILVFVRLLLNALTPAVISGFPLSVLTMAIDSLTIFAATVIVVFFFSGLLFLFVRAFRGKGKFSSSFAATGYTMPAVETCIFFLAILAFIVAKLLLLLKANDKVFEVMVSVVGAAILGMFILWCVLLVLGIKRMFKVVLWKSICVVVISILLLGVSYSLLVRALVRKMPAREIQQEMLNTEKPAAPSIPAAPAAPAAK